MLSTKRKIWTELPADAVRQRLEDILEKRIINIFFVFSLSSEKAFIGRIGDSTFTMYRIIRHRNSFLPRISGKIHEMETGTEIDLKFRMNSMTLVFQLLFWAVSLSMVYSFWGAGHSFYSVAPLMMPVLLHFVARHVYMKEVQLSRDLLLKLWDGEQG